MVFIESVKGTTVLVTGGAGFIGSHIVKAAVEHNRVKVIDDMSTGKPENLLNVDAEITVGDVGDVDLLKQLLRDVDYVFHMASIASVQRSIDEPLTVHNTNLTSTYKLFHTACEMGVKTLIYASSSAIYGDQPVACDEDMNPAPKSPYAVQKLAAEGYLRSLGETYGLKSASLRYFNIYGPQQDASSDYAAVIPIFISRVKMGEPVHIFGDGEQTRDFCNVKDAVQANIRALRNADVNAEAYNIGSGDSVSINEMVEVLAKVSGKKIKFLYQKPRPGDIRNSVADIDKATSYLSYEPKIALEEGLTELWDKYGTD
jgi:UDP-glucose 4-epimerase